MVVRNVTSRCLHGPHRGGHLCGHRFCLRERFRHWLRKPTGELARLVELATWHELHV